MPYKETDVQMMDTFFKERKGQLPDKVQLSTGVFVVNLPLFISTQLTTIFAANGKPTGQIAFDRLLALYTVLSKEIPG